MRKSTVHTRAGALLLALMLVMLMAACGSDDNGGTDAGTQPEETTVETGGDEETPEAPGEGGSQVVVTATEFEFDLPATLPAGETTFNFVNEGKQPHELSLVELSAEAPDLEKLLKLPEKKASAFFTEAGHAFAKPGKSQENAFTTELNSGARYAYVCFVQDSKTKTPHAFLGMVGEFTVE
jgi:plastocyanin